MPDRGLGEGHGRGAQEELALHRSELHFRSLLEKLPAGAYTCDPQGLITYFNPHAVELWGRAPRLNDPADRFCGSFKLFATDGSPLTHDQCWMALALQSGKAYNGHEIMIERPDGRRLTALAHANPICDESGNVLGAVNVLVDISDRKRAEETLREADRSKDEFVATLAHELRNPLAPIRSAVQILQLKGVPSAELQWALDLIERQMQQMTRLIDDLLDIARVTGNKLELRREPIELAEVLRVAVETSRPLIEASGQEFVVRVTQRPIHVHGDLTRLAQAISNLLNNAAKYTEGGGRIWLTAERRGKDAVVSVRDTGVGISAEMLPRVFEMFAQADGDRARGGLGIGLTLARRLVDMHGGALTAHSDGPGKGSEFVVRLPVIEPPWALRPSRRPCERAASDASLRILVVDDDRDSTASLGTLLRVVGHDVREAHDGHGALREAERFRPDAMLLDIGLPGLSGYEVARRARRAPWGKGVLLIATTAWGQREARLRSEQAGFDHHLVKPVDPDALMRLLTSASPAAPDPGGR